MKLFQVSVGDPDEHTGDLRGAASADPIYGIDAMVQSSFPSCPGEKRAVTRAT
jgi:hypothetical protein